MSDAEIALIAYMAAGAATALLSCAAWRRHEPSEQWDWSNWMLTLHLGLVILWPLVLPGALAELHRGQGRHRQ